MRERYVIIPAGGIGSRMGGDIPKQMLELCGVPVLRRTLDLFLDLPFEVHVIISINMTVKSMWVDYCRKEGLMLRYVLVSGGMTRFHSVRKTMKYLSGRGSGGGTRCRASPAQEGRHHPAV